VGISAVRGNLRDGSSGWCAVVIAIGAALLGGFAEELLLLFRCQLYACSSEDGAFTRGMGAFT